MTFRDMLLTGLTVLLCFAATTPVCGQTARPAIQQKFFGKWKLEEARSQIAHPGESKAIQWRLYEPDGDRVKVAWGNGEGQLGAYAAKCDGSVESAASGNIRCWQAGKNTIEGEQLDSSDQLHRYYRRVLSSHGKIMSIIWFSDAKRRQQLDRFVFTKY